ncbi:hypothetical protein RKD49_005406 [Streptomyces glaucescens]|jgi:hypothetical protein
MSLTLAQIQSAQRNELDGITAVLAEMESRIAGLVAGAANRLHWHGNHREDLAQDAREALFLALPRVATDSVDRAIGFLYSSIADALKDRVREIRYVGVDKDAVKCFLTALAEADGDPHEARRIAAEKPHMSANRAHAAHLSWSGLAYLDAARSQHWDGEGVRGGDIFHTLAAPQDETPDVVRPKVGFGAAREALRVLLRYCPLRFDLRGMRWVDLPDLVDALEDAVAVPRDAETRRYVLDAFAILRSAVSTATDGELTEDLRDETDDRRDERAAKQANVREALNRMGSQQRMILLHSFGIAGAEEFGDSDVAGLAAFIGTSEGNLKKQRSAGKVAFAKHYIAIAARTEAEAVALAEAAAAKRARGRK